MFDNITRSSFISPTYIIERISIFSIIGQRANPNSMSSKSFSALQTSIFNTGYSFPILIAANPSYKPEREEELSPKQRIDSVIEGGTEDQKSGVGSEETTFATQVSDESLREMFKYQIGDGSQRSSVVRLGTKYFMEDPQAAQKSADWAEGKNVPQDPGKEMLKFLAWREDFTIPCVVLKGKSEVELMSVTVLMNQARGSHGLASMKDIVNNLLNVAGMSEDWIARHIYLDIGSIKRMTQLSGLKSAYDNLAEADLAWNPETDGSYERKQDAYLNREASKYINKYLEEHPDTDQGARKDIGNVQDYATSLGWDREAALNVKQSEVDIAPNGTRREGRIHNGFIPGGTGSTISEDGPTEE